MAIQWLCVCYNSILCYISCVGQLIEFMQIFAEIQLTANHDPRVRMKTISNKLISLGRSYGGTERYFPLCEFDRYMLQKLPNSLFIY